MSTIGRTIKNLMKVGPANAWRQMNHISDTKAGTLVGIDALGNKYFENTVDEYYGRERWVEFASDKHAEASEIPPEWHMWMSKMSQEPPTAIDLNRPKFEIPFTPNLTGTRGAYKPYNTMLPKVDAWEPSVKARGQ
ncbi:hypothetical protein BZG36_01113 [Bifiguratus adelaidae]|uniref:NADH dehydrogenase [ubiquinone] 1 alpha subcomplex subunit n=1 Tax=Bifiguratus adelaidae TaxID=1938954 RepID=A0A261Y672_9FUNG|nr:hypothetical protein BZG36_01113 [Bifiguratus adelaidae]